MKKLFLTLTVLFSLLITVNAQDVGQKWISGSIGLSSTKVKGAGTVTNYKILPEFGYMFSENMGIGIALGYERGQVEIEDVAFKADRFVVNPFVRYNFLKGDIGGLFVDGGIQYEHSKLKGTDLKEDMYGVGFRPGATINIAKNVSFIGKFGLLGYQHSKVGELKSDWYGFDLSLDNVELGISLVF